MAAQHLDVGIHGAILAEIIVVPHFLQNFLAAEGDALVGRQKDQQVELLRRQADFFAAHPDGVAGRVDGQFAKGHGSVGAFAPRHGAVEHRLDAGHQLPRGKRLDHIIVGAAFKARQLIVFLAAGRQDDDRRVDVAGAHLPQTGHAVHERHHQIQNDQIKGPTGKLCQRSSAVSGLFTDVTGIL